MLHLWLTIYQNMAVDRHDFYDHRILIVVGRRQQKDFSKRSFAKLGNIVHLERVGRWSRVNVLYYLAW